MATPNLQRFNRLNGNDAHSLPTHVDPDTNVRYVLWSDIQDAFENVYSMEFNYLGTVNTMGVFPWSAKTIKCTIPLLLRTLSYGKQCIS